MPTRSKARPICFYLPQFHRMPENDRWWGEGFTEWTLVRAAKPRFGGHAQPVAPHADIGYYDLTDPAVRRRQGEMAREYGIHGFCYYHYWFGGTRLLHAPLDRMLEDGEPDLPFCLCWANEPWSRRWSGEDHEVLQPQVYGGREDWQAHFEALTRFFDHPNYIRVDGAPMFLIYRIGHVDDAPRMIDHWRELAAARGYAGLHVVAVEGGFDDNRRAPVFVDAVAEHHPSCVLGQGRPLVTGGVKVVPAEELWQIALSRDTGDPVRYRGACHAWDNTPRRGRDGYVVLPSRPERFTRHLREVFERSADPGHEPFVFLNAWNEWSEGAFLEPDESGGYRWLECVRDALEGGPRPAAAPALAPGLTAAPPAAGWLGEHPTVEPDVDLINTFVINGVRGSRMIDLGCATGQTGERLGLFAGADCVIGFETSEARAALARERLHEVLVVDPDIFDWSSCGNLGADLLVCGELLGRLRDPRRVLGALRPLLDPEAGAWLGFHHAGHHAHVGAALSAGTSVMQAGDPMRRYTAAEATALVRGAGYTVERVYRVYGPRPAGMGRPRARGNAVTVGGIKLDGLTGEQVDNLFCLRFFVLARPGPDHAAPTDTPSFMSFLPAVDRTISPHDSLYNVYARQGQVDNYFISGIRQVALLDTLLSAHCGRPISAVESIADYACHYGRLLRTLRAVRPDAALFAYDIDPDAVAFCVKHFGCTGRVSGWRADQSEADERHELLTSVSLLTHTGHDFFLRVLALWQRLLAPGALLCFTYLGAGYIDPWRRGRLDHYGQVDPAARECAIGAFQRDGHALAGIGTLYSSRGDYGVGFMDESVVRAAIARHQDLEYLGTLAGDDNAFNQDLAVVRRRPG